MKIVTWNVNRNKEAVRRLRDDPAPDVALLQEANQGLTGLPGVVAQPTHRQQPYDAAIVPGPGISLDEVTTPDGLPLACTFPGSFAVADVRGPNRDEVLTVISVHTMPSGTARRYLESIVVYLDVLRQQVLDLKPVFARRQGVHRMVLAGDLNVSTQLDYPHGAHVRDFFAELEQLGFYNALAAVGAARGRLERCHCSDDPCTHFETYRHPRGPGKKPRHNDYVFLSRDLELEGQPVVGEINHLWSDHAPIRFDLKL